MIERPPPVTLCSNKPRVLLLSTVPMTLWAFYRRLPAYLHGRNMEVAVAAAPGPELGYFEQLSGIRTHAIPMTRRITPLQDVVAIARLARIISANRYDVVHAFTPKAGLIGMTAATLAGVSRRAYSILGLPAETAEGWRRELLLASDRTASRLATVVLAVGEGLRRRVDELGICPAERVRVLCDGTSCGLDLRRFTSTDAVRNASRGIRATLGIPEDGLVVGFVGRLVFDKGIHTLVEAFTELCSTRCNLYLLLVGDPEPHRGAVPPETMAMIDSNPRIKRVSFDWDPVPYYAAMNVFALPTLREGFPTAPLEAAALSVPTVATRATGCVDAVLDGETGLLVEIGDTGSLGAAIARLLDDSALRAKMGRAGRRRVETQFSDDRLLEEHYRLYRSMVEGSSVEALASAGEPV